MTILVTSNYKNSQVVDGDRGDLAKFVKKNATQIMIFLAHFIRAENNFLPMGVQITKYIQLVPDMPVFADNTAQNRKFPKEFL